MDVSHQKIASIKQSLILSARNIQDGDYAKALVVLEESTKNSLNKTPSESLLLSLIQSFSDLAVIFEDEGSYEKIKACYMNEIRIYEHLLSRNFDIIENTKCVAGIFNRLATLYANNHSIEDAKEIYKKEMLLYNKLAHHHPHDSQYEKNIAFALSSLGYLLRDSDEGAAQEYLEMALDTYERISDNLFQDEKFNLEHGKTVRYITGIYENQGKFRKILRLHKKIIDSIEDVYGSAQYRDAFLLTIVTKKEINWAKIKLLGYVYASLGITFDKLGKEKRSMEYNLNAAWTYHLIVRHGMDWFPYEVRKEMEGIGAYYLSQNKFRAAVPYYERLREYSEIIVDYAEFHVPSALEISTYRQILHALGIIYYNTDKQEDSIAVYKKLLHLCRKYLKSSPDDLILQYEMANIYIRLANSLSANDQLTKAKYAFDRSKSIRKEIITKDPDFPFESSWEETYHEGYALLNLKMGKNKAAKKHIEELGRDFESFKGQFLE
ncbi:hypothetical protein [Methanolobus sp. WCC4]|uniref:hypothetical protein n=1 Tax=Methanolobus sp. WCC4 TaxID=3125784 RepID=UPI0030F8AECA